jgi:hypothetical protein
MMLALQRAAGNRAVGQMLVDATGRRTGPRLLSRDPLVSGVSVTELPGEQHNRDIAVNGSTVLTADLRSGGTLTLTTHYTPDTGPGQSVLRIVVHAPAGAVVLLNKATFRKTMDAAASRWSIRVNQDVNPDVERHVEAGTWTQEVASDPPPAPKTAPVATLPPPAPKPKPKPREAAPPPPSKLDIVRKHLSESRWDTDDLAAELSDADLARLAPKERVDLIAEIASGIVVGDEDETTIDRLLEMTPSAEYTMVGDLLLGRKKLLETLDGAIDGEEYKRYLTALTQLFVGPRTERELLGAIESAPELVWTGSGVHVEKATYQVSWTDDGKIHIRRWLGLVAMQMEAPPIDVRPSDIVVVRFMYDDPDADAKAGQFRPMPAAAFVGLVNLQFKRDAWLAVNVAFIVGGVGGVIGGATRLARFLAALDVLVNTANIAIDMYRAQIAATQRGRTFLRAWDTVQMMIAVYGLARVAMHIPQVIRNARAMWRAARPGVLEHGSTTAANEMEKSLTKIEQALEDAEQEAKVNPPGNESPAGAPHTDATPGAPEGKPAVTDSPVSSATPAPPRKLRLMHGTEQKGFEGLGGLGEGKIDVTKAPGAHQDLGRGFYLTTDEATAAEYGVQRNLQATAGKGGGMTHVLAYDVALEDLGNVVDIRPGGRFRADWEKFIEQPPFRTPPGVSPPAGMESRRAFLTGFGAERRGIVFEEFLASIDQKGADAIIGPLGEPPFTGITAGHEATQVCIRSQTAADKLNALMRGAGH